MRSSALLLLMAIAPAGGCSPSGDPIRFRANAGVRAKLKPRSVGATYVQPGGGEARLAMAGLHPLSLASGDLNTDGYPDLVAGYAARDGGVLIVHLANPEAFSPLSPAALRGVARGEFPPPFQATAVALSVPTAPEFLAVGDFCRDSRPSILYGTRGARILSVLAGDGSGHLQAARSVPLPGKLTALATGSMRANDGGASVVAGVEGDAGGAVLVYEAALGGLCGTPLAVPVDGTVTNLAIGDLDGDPYADVALVSGGQLRILHGRREITKADGQRLDTIAAAGAPVAIAVGSFSAGSRRNSDIAVLGADGAVRVLGRDGAGVWKPGATVQATADPTGAKLVSGRISGAGVDDLIVVAPSERRVVLYNAPGARASAAGEPGALAAVAELDSESAAVAVVPTRLNVMGSPGLAMLLRDAVEPVALSPQPGVTYNVTLASDSQNGACTAPSGSPLASSCTTLRAAVAAANANPGQDAIVFDPSLNGTPVILAAGRMVVTDALTIVGNGQSSTQIWGGPGPSSGVDSVFSLNPGGSVPGFPASISGLTIQYGLNTSTSGNTEGGALDFTAGEDNGGGLAIANCNILQNGTTNGDGGGMSLWGGTITIANTIISGNQTRVQGMATGVTGYGGGIMVQVAQPYPANITITNSSISNNSASTPGQAASPQDGGGIFSMAGVVNVLTYPFSTTYYYNSIAIHGSNISNNQASGQGAGLNGHFLIDQNTAISGNAAAGAGGGVFGWFAINSSSLLNNSSPLDGSALVQLDPGGLGGDPSQPLSSIHSSRIAGNGPAQVQVVDACVGVDVANNWWGSNASPASQVNPSVVAFSPWLVMTLAPPSSVPAGGTGTLTASIASASDGSTGFAVPDGTPVAFSGTLGTVSPASATTLAGSASSTYTAGNTAGAASASATIDSQTLTASFSVSPSPAPTLASVSPASGVQGTSVPVTLTGSNFVAGATVAVSNPGIAAGSVTVVSATQITAMLTIAGAAALGAASVTVTTSSGTSGAAVFTVNPPAPTLASVSPASGVQDTSVPVTLTGSNFVAGATVGVGNPGITVGSVTVVSATQITATLTIAATAALGAASVTVTTSGGTSGAAVFTVNPPVPVLTSVSPASGVQGTSVPVTFTGANFVAGAMVVANRSGITVTNLTVVSATQITATLTIGAGTATGAVSLVVATSGGASSAVSFTVNPPAPTLASVSPASGVQGTSVPVTLTGTNFVAGATVATTSSGITVGSVTVVSATKITATLTIAASAALGAANVTVTSTGGTSGAAVFTVKPPAPVLTSVSPASGVQGTSVPVTFTGANFVAGAMVVANRSGITVTSLTVVSATQITATLSVGAGAATGTVSLVVATSGGASSAVSFTVNPPAPTLASVSPASGVQGTSVPVTLTGTNFVSGATVGVGNPGITVGSATLVSATQITATLTTGASAATGAANVTVTTGGGTSGVAVFTVNPR